MRDGWEVRPLGTVLNQIHRPVPVVDVDVVPFAGVRLDAGGVYHRIDQPAAEVKTKVLNRIVCGDIVYNRMWATRGSFGRVGEEADGCLVTNDFPVFSVDRAHATSQYIALLFEWRPFLEMAAAAATGTTDRRRLNERDFVRLTLPMPPVSEQRRIVDLVSALDVGIEMSTRAAAADPYPHLLRFLDEREDHIPLSEVVDRAFAGGTPSRSRADYFIGAIPWLKSGEVENDSIADAGEHISAEALAGSSAKMVPPGSTVVAMYGQGETKGRAGYLVKPVATNQAVLALVPDESMVRRRFLLHAVRARTESLRRRAVGNAQPNLSKELVLAESIPLPSLDEQDIWLGTLEAARAVRMAADRHLSELVALRSNLLAALLSGEHEIPESYDALIDGLRWRDVGDR